MRLIVRKWFLRHAVPAVVLDAVESDPILLRYFLSWRRGEISRSQAVWSALLELHQQCARLRAELTLPETARDE